MYFRTQDKKTNSRQYKKMAFFSDFKAICFQILRLNLGALIAALVDSAK